MQACHDCPDTGRAEIAVNATAFALFHWAKGAYGAPKSGINSGMSLPGGSG
jgi:hypothetical protein